MTDCNVGEGFVNGDLSAGVLKRGGLRTRSPGQKHDGGSSSWARIGALVSSKGNFLLYNISYKHIDNQYGVKGRPNVKSLEDLRNR